jgi:sigma-E factor negative regulatory protein RseB
MKPGSRRTRLHARLAAGAAALLFALPACAQDATEPIDAHALLERMSAAAKERNYDGVFVYQRGAHLDTMRIIHRYANARTRERLVSLSGTAREVIRTDDNVKCFFPDDRAVMVQSTRPKELFPSSFAVSIDAIAQHYAFDVLGGDRVADRSTWVVAINPKQTYRYGYRLWVDRDTGLLLKSTVLDNRGESLEQIMFTSIALPDSIPDELLEPGASGEGFTWYTDEEAADDGDDQMAGDWRVKWVPAGFSMRDYEVKPLSSDRMLVDHMVFSDGLAMVSVFVEKLKSGTGQLQGFSSMGAINAYSRIFDRHQVTVVGEVPPITVRQIAASVVRFND